MVHNEWDLIMIGVGSPHGTIVHSEWGLKMIRGEEVPMA